MSAKVSHFLNCVCPLCEAPRSWVPWTPPELTATPRPVSDRMLTDEQLGDIYADLWSALNSKQLGRLYDHIRAQADFVKQFYQQES